jgi:hypothetical protein
VHCCDFHGCGNYKFHRRCRLLYDAGEKWKVEGKHKLWLTGLHIHHYARSLEKFLQKQRTWETASAGKETYDILNFFERSFGYYYDPSALRYSCQLRDHLSLRTNVSHYVRPGDSWYRNPEFGRLVADPSKRGRGGGAVGKKMGWGKSNKHSVVSSIILWILTVCLYYRRHESVSSGGHLSTCTCTVCRPYSFWLIKLDSTRGQRKPDNQPDLPAEKSSTKRILLTSVQE